jgi:hypothetical protein
MPLQLPLPLLLLNPLPLLLLGCCCAKHSNTVAITGWVHQRASTGDVAQNTAAWLLGHTWRCCVLSAADRGTRLRVRKHI